MREKKINCTWFVFINFYEFAIWHLWKLRHVIFLFFNYFPFSLQQVHSCCGNDFEHLYYIYTHIYVYTHTTCTLTHPQMSVCVFRFLLWTASSVLYVVKWGSGHPCPSLPVSPDFLTFATYASTSSWLITFIFHSVPVIKAPSALPVNWF